MEIFPRLQPPPQSFPFITQASQSHLIPRRIKINRTSTNRKLKDIQCRSFHFVKKIQHLLTISCDKVDRDD